MKAWPSIGSMPAKRIRVVSDIKGLNVSIRRTPYRVINIDYFFEKVLCSAPGWRIPPCTAKGIDLAKYLFACTFGSQAAMAKLVFCFSS